MARFFVVAAIASLLSLGTPGFAQNKAPIRIGFSNGGAPSKKIRGVGFSHTPSILDQTFPGGSRYPLKRIAINALLRCEQPRIVIVKALDRMDPASFRSGP